MIPVAIDAITADHIRSLIENGVREGRTIEYKQTLPGPTDADKREFLADVSSFANAAGGDLLYGIAAESGLPTKVAGLPGFDSDKDRLRLESVIRDAIAPRILALQMRAITGFAEGSVLVIRIPKSWVGPHMVTFKGSSRFFARSIAGKFQMDVDELRSAFALAGDLPQRIRGWRDDRIAKIIVGETPVPLRDDAKLVLHVVPVDSFQNTCRISAADFTQSQIITGFPALGGGHWGYRPNLDGFMTFVGDPRSRQKPSAWSYCQVFRSGCVEAVRSDLGASDDGLPSIANIWYEKVTLEATARYIKTLEATDIHPPFVIMLAIVGAKGASFHVDARRLDKVYPIDRDVLLLPDVLLEELPRHLPRVMRPIFDAVWNACGLPRSFNYNEEGNWTADSLDGVPQEQQL